MNQVQQRISLTWYEFFHITHRTNTRSILKHGLKLRYARNELHPWVWLCANADPATIAHVAKQHNWEIADMVILRVAYPREFTIEHPLTTVYQGRAYKTRRDISPAHLSLVTAQEMRGAL